MMMEKKDNCITKSGLKERGWTEFSIKKFLGEPDMTKDNPHYKRGPPMCLYLLKRVKRKERTKGFIEWKERSLKRRDGAKRAVLTKKEQLLNMVNSWNIQIPSKSIDSIRKNAIHHYNDFQEYKFMYYNNYDDHDAASLDSEPDFLDRIVVNYIRHELSSYEDRLDDLFGRVGKGRAYNVLNRKIFKAIKKKYPSLGDECDRQMNYKFGDRHGNDQTFS